MIRINASLMILPLLISLASISYSAEDGYLLRNKFQESEVSSLIFNVTNEGVSTIDEMQFPIESGLELEMRYETTEVQSDNIAILKIAIKKMVMQDPSLGGQEPIDLVEAWKLDEEEMTLKVNQLGEVLDFEDAVQPKTFKMSGLTEAGGSYTQQNPYLLVPEKEIPLGYSWTEERAIPFSAASEKMIAHTTYTLDRVREENGEKIAVIKTTSSTMNKNVEVNPAKQGQNLGMVKLQFKFNEYSSTGSGQIIFNMDKGQIETIENQSNMTIDLSGNTNINNADMPTKFVMKFTVTAQGKFVEGTPKNNENTNNN